MALCCSPYTGAAISKPTDLDQRVLASLSGRAKIEALLIERGFPTVRSFAEASNEGAEDVSRCLNGGTVRLPTMHRIRRKLCKALDLERPVLDELLDGPLPEIGLRDPSPFDD